MAKPRFSTDGFDAVPPPDVLEELRGQKSHRPPPPVTPPPVKPAPPARDWRGSALAVLGVALVAVVITVQLAHQPEPKVAAPIAIAPTPPAPSLRVPAPTPAPRVSSTPEQPILPPRARLVKLPPPTPRAALVRLPEPPVVFAITPEHIGQSHDIMMPYGTVVRATLRGFLDQESQLPRVGHIGDMYVVGSVPWIWIQVPGTTAPTWIDP